MSRRPPAGLLRGADGPLPVLELGVGEWRVRRAPAVLYTLLGSCVAACLYDARAGVGGMNHILLPGRAGAPGAGRGAARYGLDAMEQLVAELVRHGARRERLCAKLFGGGHVIRGMSPRDSPGARNVAFIVDVMEVERIPVVRADLGGAGGRKVWFRTDTGEVRLQRVGLRGGRTGPAPAPP